MIGTAVVVIVKKDNVPGEGTSPSPATGPGTEFHTVRLLPDRGGICNPGKTGNVQMGSHGSGNFLVHLESGGVLGPQKGRGDGGAVTGIRSLSTVLAGDDLPDNGLSGQKLF